MNTKFVYHSNGKITRSVINGIPIISERSGVSSLSAATDGNYIIVKSGDTYSLTETTAGLSSVAPQNLTNITPNNKDYLLAIDRNNNFTQLLFTNGSLNNTFTYKNNKWVLEKNGLFQQFADVSKDSVNAFSIPLINTNKETVILTPSTAQAGKYCINVKQVGDLPTVEKISLTPSDMLYSKVDSNVHVMIVNENNNFDSIVIPAGKTWYNGISKKSGTFYFDQLSLYRQNGGSGTVNGFAMLLIGSNTNNKFISLPADETGEYVIDYNSTTQNPTLKKITYITDVNPNTLYNNSPPTNDSLMIVNNNQFKTIPNPATSGNIMLKYNSDNTWSYSNFYTPRFTRFSLDTQKDFALPASGTTKVQDIFQELTGETIENNSLLHFKIFFYLDDVSLQEDAIGTFTLQRQTGTSEYTELSSHYIYNPVENLIAATFTFPYAGNISSLYLVTAMASGVRIKGGIKSELLVETQIRLSS